MTSEANTVVPRTLVQFWDKPDLPSDIALLVPSWRTYSGLDCHMLNEESAEEFISDAYGATYLALFRKCALPAMKSDFFRLLAVYHYGGWYADCSIECLKPLADLIPVPAPSILYYRRWHGGVNNGFFGAVRNSFYLEKMINVVAHNLTHSLGKTVWEATGPKVWNDMFPKNNDLADVLELSHKQLALVYVVFHQNLAHKQGGKHWSEMQKKQDIFSATE